MTTTDGEMPPHARGVVLGPVSVRRHARIAWCVVAATAAVVAVTVASVAAGGDIGVGDVARTFLGAGTATDRLIVVEFRLPRTLTAALVGVCLAIAGALSQTITRNPLATPDIMGVTSGASVGAVGAIVLGGGGYAVGEGTVVAGIPLCAAAGAVLAAAAVYSIGGRGGGASGFRLILVGIGVAATLDAVTSYLLVRAQISEAAAAAQWLVGSVSSASWTTTWPLIVVTAATAPIAVALSSSLAIGQLGDDLARGVGLSIAAHRAAVLAVTVVLTAAAVAAAGPVGFVALVAPQIAIRLTASDRPPLVLSGLLGALVTLSADLAGRTLFPVALPIGIVTVTVGAPYLIWLLTRGRASAAKTS